MIGRTNHTAACTRQGWGRCSLPAHAKRLARTAKENVSLDDLVGGVDRGILIYGRGSYSIDQPTLQLRLAARPYGRSKRQRSPGCARRGLSIAHHRFLGRVRTRSADRPRINSAALQRRQREPGHRARSRTVAPSRASADQRSQYSSQQVALYDGSFELPLALANGREIAHRVALAETIWLKPVT